MATSVAGRLLVASPKLVDPNFSRTVVYIGMHDENGAFGLILNRPLQVEVAQHLGEWESLVSTPPFIFRGGPVDESSVVGLARPLDATLPGWSEMSAGVGIVDLRQESARLAAGVAEMRMFLGYSGWTAGQLEQELEDDAWFVVEIDHDDIFTGDPDRLWHRVLRRQPGKLAMFAYFPEDPRVN